MWAQLVCHMPLSPLCLTPTGWLLDTAILCLTPSGWAFDTAIRHFLGGSSPILCATVDNEKDQILLCNEKDQTILCNHL